VRQLRGDAVTDFSVGGLDVVVPIPYWRPPWFMAASLCGVAGLGAAVAWWAGRLANRRRIALLEQEQERQRDRARIARDIHDSLGARLTQIAMTSDLMRRSATQPTTAETVPLDEQLDEIYRTAQSLTRSVDEIVWALAEWGGAGRSGSVACVVCSSSCVSPVCCGACGRVVDEPAVRVGERGRDCCLIDR
jgi:signal transduction histidine kinase